MKKALNIIKNILVYLVVALAIFMMVFTIISVSVFDRNDREIFGFKAFIVLTDSMSESEKNKDFPIHFNAGDLVIVKNVKDPSTLKPGDVITFQSLNKNDPSGVPYGSNITHAIDRKTTAEGRPGFVTYGTNTDTSDETVVTYEFIRGKYVTHIPNVGNFFNFLKQPQGYFICIFTPFMLLIIYQAIKSISLFKRYKAEQTDAMKEERIQLEQERQASLEMMKELQALKAQLEAQGVSTATVTGSGEPTAPKDETAQESTNDSEVEKDANEN
ncbi:MAG: signal peptidase I [Clostridia bacterium]|nr:signal peptidase I [Clostridia bacterium]